MGAQLRNTYIGYQAQISPDILGCPIGGIIGWAKTLAGCPALAINFLECNGQAIADASSPFNGLNMPALNNPKSFLRGHTASGGTGGADSGTTSTSSANKIAADTVGDTYALDHHTHTLATIPVYYEVVWIMRIK